MQVTPVSKTAITSMIAGQIQDLVIGGKLQPGEKLPSERILCEEFKASRTAIREAVSGLISKGILERRNNGAYVKLIDTGVMLEPISLLVATKNISIFHILEARTVLEIENAGLAAERATPEDLGKLEQCVAALENPQASEAEIRYRAAEFHQLIAQSTHNPLLEEFYMLMSQIMNNDPRAIKTLLESASYHRDVLKKVQARDASDARKEMQKHLERVRKSH